MVFIRTNDLIMPNIVQVTGSRGLGIEESYMIAALLTRWAVPADDTNTYYIGYIHDNPLNTYDAAPEGSASTGPIATRIGHNRMNLIGQTAFRPYEERQREPGDYDAMVSPGPIANRASEHLASSDAGVALFRRMLAQEIARVERGEAPQYPKERGKHPVRTYCYSMSMRAAGAKIEGMEGLHDVGRRVTQLVIDSVGMSPVEREEMCQQRTRALLTERAA